LLVVFEADETKMPDRTFSVRLPDDLAREVDRLARMTDRSRSSVVKDAIAAYLNEEKAYLEAIDEAVREADKGVFVSGEAVSAWLASWGTDDVLPEPEPDIFLQDRK